MYDLLSASEKNQGGSEGTREREEAERERDLKSTLCLITGELGRVSAAQSCPTWKQCFVHLHRSVIGDGDFSSLNGKGDTRSL